MIFKFIKLVTTIIKRFIIQLTWQYEYYLYQVPDGQDCVVVSEPALDQVLVGVHVGAGDPGQPDQGGHLEPGAVRQQYDVLSVVVTGVGRVGEVLSPLHYRVQQYVHLKCHIVRDTKILRLYHWFE